MIKSFSIYTLAGFLGAGINFLVMPLLSHYLTPEEYGLISLFNVYVTMLIPLIGVVASGLINVEYYQVEDKREFASLFSSIQIIPFVPFLLFCLAICFFPSQIARLSELSGLGIGWLLLLPVLALLTIYVETFLNYLIVIKASKKFSFYNVLKVLIEVCFSMLLIIYYDMGWQGRILSWLLTNIIYTAIFIWYFHKLGLFTPGIKWSYVIKGISFGAPLILHTIGKFVVNQSDRLFITKYISLAEAGVYNMGYQVGMILLIIVNAFGNYFTPYLYDNLYDITQQKKIAIVRMGYLGVIMMLLVLLFITLMAPFFFTYFIDKRYAGGTLYVFWTGLSYVLWGIYIIFSGFIYYYKKTSILAWLSVLSVTSNIVLNFLLVKHFGAIGASYATCFSFLIISVCVFCFANKISPLPWFDFKSILRRK